MSIHCKDCLYGRHLGGKDYGCRSEKRRDENRQDSNVKLVNKEDYSCDYAEMGFIK